MALACGPTPRAAEHAAPAPSVDASPPTATARAPSRWARFDEVSAWPAVTERPFASRGHLSARSQMEVRVHPDSRDAYVALLPGTTLGDGTLIAAFHHDPRRGQPGPVYVMEKSGGVWRFSIVSPDGVLEQSGELELCRRCHAEAVSDHVFGLPRRR